MRIHALCLVKNESDVIDACLTAAANWCDQIYVYDNGSTDGTWEQVNDLARSIPEIVPFRQADKPFKDELRADIFDHYKNNCTDDDWWCILDADEFYIDDPRVFLAKVPSQQRFVVTASFSYYFTNRDAEMYDEDPSRYADSIPVFDKCRYYLNHWSEVRFFRHAHNLTWTSGGLPAKISEWRPYPMRIWVRHYAYRSPHQIDKRVATRSAAIASGEFTHEAVPNWATMIDPDVISADPRRGLKNWDERHAAHSWIERIVDASKLNYDAGDRKLVVREDLMPPMPHSSVRWLRARLGRNDTMRHIVATYRARARKFCTPLIKHDASGVTVAPRR
jgi:glycosyltransferase involved in cell wall biosynthesis